MSEEFTKPVLSEIEIMRFWLAGKEYGLSQRKLAKILGMKFNSLHSAIERAKKKYNEGDGKVTEEVDGNTATLGARGRVKSIEQLLDACDYDPEKFIVERALLNKWDAYAKAKKMEIRWEDGKIQEGYIQDSGRLTIEPLWQVKAWLKSRVPEAVNPIVHPVHIEIKNQRLRTVKGKRRVPGFRRALFVCDPHFGFEWDGAGLVPFHDRRVLGIILQLLHDEEFDVIVLNGDLLDLAEVSDKFVTSPAMARTMQPTLYEAGWFLAQVRLLQPGAEIVLLEGNHEARIPRTMLKHSAWAYGLKPYDIPDDYDLLSVRSMLSLDKIGIDWVGGYPESYYWLNDYIVAEHGSIARAKSGQTAMAVLAGTQVSRVFGHVHREESATRTDYYREGSIKVGAYTPGCVCRIDGVVPGVKRNQNWQQGLGIMEYDGSWHSYRTISIRDGVGMNSGSRIEPINYLPELNKMFDIKF